jgi:6-phosphogluconolactonase
MAYEAVTGRHRLFIGTANPTPTGGDGPGVFAAYFEDGQLSEPEKVAGELTPSFLAVVPGTASPLFACLGGDDDSCVGASYATAAADAGAQDLRLMSRADAGSHGAVHISVSEDGRAMVCANYMGSSAASFLVDAEGNLSVATVVAFPPDEHGPNASRQEESHAHCASFSPDGNYVLVNDLGLDRIHVFRLDHATAVMTPHVPDHWASVAGAGPRHILKHPNGVWIYNINELHSTIDQLEWNAEAGVLSTLRTVSTLPPHVSADGLRACEMVFSQDLQFLYAANRVHESFAVFAVDADTGALTWMQDLANPGLESRHIALDPSGKWLLSANQFSDEISVFPVDVATGLLGPRTATVRVPGPSCLLFVE